MSHNIALHQTAAMVKSGARPLVSATVRRLSEHDSSPEGQTMGSLEVDKREETVLRKSDAFHDRPDSMLENAGQEVTPMSRRRSGIYSGFVDGLVMAVTAHIAAAIALLSTEGLGRFVGHVIGVIAIRLLGEWPNWIRW